MSESAHIFLCSSLVFFFVSSLSFVAVSVSLCLCVLFAKACAFLLCSYVLESNGVVDTSHWEFLFTPFISSPGEKVQLHEH